VSDFATSIAFHRARLLDFGDWHVSTPEPAGSSRTPKAGIT
jgi:hypothetical protein